MAQFRFKPGDFRKAAFVQSGQDGEGVDRGDGETAIAAKNAARANITGAGFRRRSQNAMRANSYPSRGPRSARRR
jgi:hypothetical protein